MSSVSSLQPDSRPLRPEQGLAAGGQPRMRNSDLLRSGPAPRRRGPPPRESRYFSTRARRAARAARPAWGFPPKANRSGAPDRHRARPKRRGALNAKAEKIGRSVLPLQAMIEERERLRAWLEKLRHPAFGVIRELGFHPVGTGLLINEMRLTDDSGASNSGVGRFIIPVAR